MLKPQKQNATRPKSSQTHAKRLGNAGNPEKVALKWLIRQKFLVRGNVVKAKKKKER